MDAFSYLICELFHEICIKFKERAHGVFRLFRNSLIDLIFAVINTFPVSRPIFLTYIDTLYTLIFMRRTRLIMLGVAPNDSITKSHRNRSMTVTDQRENLIMLKFFYYKMYVLNYKCK